MTHTTENPSLTPRALDRLLSPHELALYLGVPLRTIYRWRYQGDGPPGFRVGRHVRYRNSEVDQWLEDHRDPA